MSARSFPLATLLTLVSATLGAAQDMPEDVTAAGNEPFWRVDIAGGDFTLSRPDYEPLMLSVVERRTEADGTTVIVSASSSPALSAFLSLAPGPCADTMADQTYPYTATLELGDTVLQGCGGDPRDLLTAEEVWTVTEIAGEPIVPGTEVTMSFADSGAVAGSGGCNRFTALYVLTGEGLSLGPAAATRMACPDDIMAKEQVFFAVFDVVMSFSFSEVGELLLIGPQGPAIVARGAE
jgi:heat shock protein HslJ